MNNKSSFEKNGGTYRMVNGYRIPNLDLPEEAKKPLGRWGQAHLEYLSHNKRYFALNNSIVVLHFLNL